MDYLYNIQILNIVIMFTVNCNSLTIVLIEIKKKCLIIQTANCHHTFYSIDKFRYANAKNTDYGVKIRKQFLKTKMITCA